jgi:glucose-6-phosphate isomerase
MSDTELTLDIEPGFNIQPKQNPMGFTYGAGTFGPMVEHRTLDSIRPSLKDPNCKGPEIVYSIAMDVGKEQHRTVLDQKGLLFGVVTYASGRLGEEPVRSQGHIHAVSKYSEGWSTPEVYEIWRGKAIIYMQETAEDHPGRCFAVTAEPGEIVIVPPGWAHATISADPQQSLTFGAWCVRDYAFEYDQVRAHGGLAWFPILSSSGEITWQPNSNYHTTKLVEKPPQKYPQFHLDHQASIYQMFEADHQRFDFVVQPAKAASEWKSFIP